MKIKTNVILIVVALAVYWVGLCNASAFYNPGTQQWLNRDPIAERGGLNLYKYDANNPINLIDPNGNKFIDALPIFGTGWHAIQWFSGSVPGMSVTDYADSKSDSYYDCQQNVENEMIKYQGDATGTGEAFVHEFLDVMGAGYSMSKRALAPALVFVGDGGIDAGLVLSIEGKIQDAAAKAIKQYCPCNSQF